MSQSYFCWTFPANECDVTSELHSLESADRLLKALDGSDQLLMAASRNDWLLSMLDALALGLRVTGLAAFHTMAYVVSSERVPHVIGEVQSLLDAAKSNPGLCAELLEGGYSEGDVLLALRLSKPASTPHLGPEDADEGDSPRYLFAWLKSLLSVLHFANENSQCVVHVQPESQRRQDASN